MVSSDLSLGGFAGESGGLSEKVKEKKRLLEAEGVKVLPNNKISRESLYIFGSE